MEFIMLNELDLNNVRNAITNEIDWLNRQLVLSTQILSFMQQFNGQTITRWHESKLKKHFFDRNIRLVRKYGMTHIYVADYEGVQIVNMLVAHTESPFVWEHEEITKFNECYLLNADRIKDLNKWYKNIGHYVLQYNEFVQMHNNYEKMFGEEVPYPLKDCFKFCD